MSEAAARESIDSGHKVRLPAEGESALDKARPAPVRASRPKLCVIVPAHWEAVMGGSQYQAKMLVDHLLERDACEIYYLARRVPAERPRGYEIRQIARPDGIRRYGEVFDSFDLLACLKQIEPDIIYQRVGCAYTGIAAHYARRYGKRCVWHVACDQDVLPFERTFSRNLPIRYLDKLLLEYGLRHADAIVTQTRTQAENLWRHYRRRAVATIPNYHPLPSAPPAKSGKTTVLWVANVKPLKQPEIFLRLARDLVALDDVEFVMIGKPMGKPEWWGRIAAEAERLPNLRFAGPQPQEAVNEALARAHILVSTSAYEGFPNTFIQAWLHEVPVLSLAVNPDGVFDSRSIGICAGSYEALKRCLVELVRDPERRDAMGAAARRHAEACHADPANLARLAAIVTGVGQRSFA